MAAVRRSGFDQLRRAAVRGRADHRRRDQRPRDVPRSGDAGSRCRPHRARRLRQRRFGRFVAHDPRRHPLPRERRVPPRPRVGHRAKCPAADRAALRAAAADHDPDLHDVLRGAQRPAAIPAPRLDDATERGAVLIKIGLVIYDSFSRSGGRVPRHEFHGRRRSLAELPALNPAVKYTATYWDASLHDPERLAIDVLRDGRAAGGRPGARRELCRRRGRRRAAASSCATPRRAPRRRSRHPSSSTPPGPWTDLTNLALGDPTRHMGGTKGSHIVLDHPELLAATGGRELFFENKDGRIVLIYPLKGRVLVGTTDLEHDMAEPIVCTDAEVDYFIDLIAAGAARDRGRPVADRLPLLGGPAAARAMATSPRASSRASTGSTPRRSRRGRHGAQPRRRQVDDVPRVGRAPRRSHARTARAAARAIHEGRARSAADAGSRPPSAPDSSGSRGTRPGCRSIGSRRSSTATAPSPTT